MENKNWYELKFKIHISLEEIIVWKLNDLGIFSFAFQSSVNCETAKEVLIWLPLSNWNKKERIKLENKIGKLLNKNDHIYCGFKWNIIREQDWLNYWKNFWEPKLIGNNFLILPYWIKLHKKYYKKNVIKIDPGAAFGTGSHPTTALCLEKMEDLLFLNKKILDIGSGSGILGIAAKSLGARRIFSVDNDYLAINSTKANYQLNFFNQINLNTYLGSFDELSKKNEFTDFDFVLCNILANVIKDLIPFISKCLKISGIAIFSGILNSQKDEIIRIINNNYLKLEEVSSKKDWVCITAQKIK